MIRTLLISSFLFAIFGCQQASIQSSSTTNVTPDPLQTLKVEYELSTGATTIYINKVLYNKNTNELFILIRTKDSPMGHAAFHTATDTAEVPAPENAEKCIYVVGDDRFEKIPSNQKRKYSHIESEYFIECSLSGAELRYESDN